MHERNGRSKQELLSGDGNTLAERRNNLAAEIQNLEESRNGEMFRGEEQSVDERLRVLQAQMDTLTLEMRQYLDPPSYT
jgi:Tfp pilus assembly PilM family ATPase